MPQIAQLAETYSSQIFWLLVIFGFVFFVVGKGMVPKVMGTVELRDKQINDDLDAAVVSQDGGHHGVHVSNRFGSRERIKPCIEDIVDAQLDDHHAHAGVALSGHVVAEIEAVVVKWVCVGAVRRLSAVVRGFPPGPALVFGRSRATCPEQR